MWRGCSANSTRIGTSPHEPGHAPGLSQLSARPTFCSFDWHFAARPASGFLKTACRAAGLLRCTRDGLRPTALRPPRQWGRTAAAAAFRHTHGGNRRRDQLALHEYPITCDNRRDFEPGKLRRLSRESCLGAAK